MDLDCFKIKRIEEVGTMESIKSILMARDNMSADEADNLIAEAEIAFQVYLDEGDISGAEDICNEYFSLEPDYLDEFI